MSEPDQPNFRVLKIVVVVLGIAILVMTAIIIYTAISRFGESTKKKPAKTAVTQTAPAPAAADAAKAWSRDLGDGRIVDVQLSDGLLMLRVETPAGRVSVEVLDPATGRSIGRAAGR